MKKLLIPVLCTIIFSACKHNDIMPEPPGLPTLTTAIVTNIAATTATSGGTITSAGGGAITASGVCWSRTNPTPTISDDTTKGMTTTGAFVSTLTRLSANTAYYVRAYAISNVGVGYGNTISFTSTNTPPEARSVSISGTAKVGELLRSHYTYFDAENNTEGDTRFQWYVANDTTGSPVASISSEISATYTPTAADRNKFLRVGILPRATTGAPTGIEVRSPWIGPIGAAEPTTVTFMYNGQTVTYGILISQTTGRKWLDRNLGAPATPNAYNDWQNYGDLFQWGRKADGHQLVNRASSTLATTAVNGTTTNLSTTDDPGNSLFIITSANPFDWRTPQSADLWQSPGGTNNACPLGWHVPTRNEWLAEGLGTAQDAYTKLKITLGGLRNFNDGSFSLTATDGLYWTSTVFNNNLLIPYTFNIAPAGLSAYASTSNVNSTGLSVRCIKD